MMNVTGVVLFVSALLNVSWGEQTEANRFLKQSVHQSVQLCSRANVGGVFNINSTGL